MNFFQLQDVFGLGHRSNVNLVFDFMETDLEVTSNWLYLQKLAIKHIL